MYNQLSALKKEDEKYFNQALLCLDMGLNPKDLRINEQISLSYTYDYMEDKQKVEKKEKVNNKKCYKIRIDKNLIVYIEKDTGLVLKKKEGYITKEDKVKDKNIIEYLYEFNNVTEEDMKEPNLEEYEIKK